MWKSPSISAKIVGDSEEHLFLAENKAACNSQMERGTFEKRTKSQALGIFNSDEKQLELRRRITREKKREDIEESKKQESEEKRKA